MCLSSAIPVLQAVATAVIGGAGIWIALEQKRLADARLQNDTFDRKLQVFEAARDLVREVIKGRPVEVPALVAFLRGTDQAVFFFGAAVIEYLDALYKQATEFNLAFAIIENPSPEHDLQAAIRRKAELLLWFHDQFYGMVKIFKPDMALSSRISYGARAAPDENALTM
jgi:hypothetical protein